MTEKPPSVKWLAGIGAALLLAGGLLARTRQQASSDAGMTVAGSRPPPGVVFVTVALGGFRGLLADILWVRAATLQEEGRFVEVAQLSDWITRLEPRSSEVWAYHAWNMAYNITAMFPDPQDRWRWIRNGLQLLRDRGVRVNERSPSLCWELGWLYADKVSGRRDEAGAFYRVAFAAEMNAILGGRGSVGDPARKVPVAPSALAAAGLDPAAMSAVESTYGPLDWRLPETHAVYWGYQGGGTAGDSAWCQRLMIEGMEAGFRDGLLFFDPAMRLYVRGPRPDLAARAVREWLPALRVSAGSVASIQAENAWREAVVCLDLFGKEGESAAAYELLNRRLPEVVQGRTLKDFVAEELRIRAHGLGRTARDAALGFLVRGHLWKALGRPALVDGYTRLARACFDTALQFPSQRMAESDWDTLNEEARSAASAQLPELLRKP